MFMKSPEKAKAPLEILGVSTGSTASEQLVFIAQQEAQELATRFANGQMPDVIAEAIARDERVMVDLHRNPF